MEDFNGKYAMVNLQRQSVMRAEFKYVQRNITEIIII